MVFSSMPAYPGSSIWNNDQQQPNLEPGGSSGINPHLTLPPPPQPPPFLPPHVAGGSSIRPGSMADRARMANIPMPGPGLKCPRCDSTNTKFCYYNNYNLSQPRHFCKTCRRYWTRGGSLRSVPVGGGCRRNKRSKGGRSSSNSPAASGDIVQTSGSGGSGSSSSTITNTTSGVSSLLGLAQRNSPLRFMAPSNATQLSHNYGSQEIGSNYYAGNISAPMVATSDLNYMSTDHGGAGVEQWRLKTPRISSFAGLDMPSGLYQFQGGGLEPSGYVGEYGGQVRPKFSGSDMKMEDNNNRNNNQLQELNLSRQLLGIQGNDQYWASTNGTSWTDLSGFTTTATTSPQYK